jgi:SAM-dependent methyltransferase
MSVSVTTHLVAAPTGRSDPLVEVLLACGRMLGRVGYRFTTVTPDTHQVVLARRDGERAGDWRDVFGWNLPFGDGMLPTPLLDGLSQAGLLEPCAGGLRRLRLRCSTIGERLFFHSGHPTSGREAVFFGPDTYRFVTLLTDVLRGGGRLLELGAGSGAAAICMAQRYDELVLTDINPVAVRFAQANCALADVRARMLCTDLAAGVTGLFDAIIANPPYLIDPAHRLYRDGGELGIAVALRMVEAALPLLAPGGRLVLYSGAPVVDGRDLLAERLEPLLRRGGLPAHYDELDVDVFGSSLANEVYTSARVERLALVAVVIDRPAEARRENDDSAWRWP